MEQQSSSLLHRGALQIDYKRFRSPVLLMVADAFCGDIKIRFPLHPHTPEGSGRLTEGDDYEKLALLAVSLLYQWQIRICDQCGESIAGGFCSGEISLLENCFMFFATSAGPKIYFLCERCAEKWREGDLYSPPNVLAKAMAGIDQRRKGTA